MATVSSAVGICNLALDTLKQESVANIESPVSIEESLCARWYDVTRRELLRSHPWSFARTRVKPVMIKQAVRLFIIPAVLILLP